MQWLTHYIKAMYSRLQILWSEMLPNSCWGDIAIQKKKKKGGGAENSRQMTQHRTRQIVHVEGGVIIGHLCLTSTGNFWSPDGVRLNNMGMEMFISVIEEELLALMRNQST